MKEVPVTGYVPPPPPAILPEHQAKDARMAENESVAAAEYNSMCAAAGAAAAQAVVEKKMGINADAAASISWAAQMKSRIQQPQQTRSQAPATENKQQVK